MRRLYCGSAGSGIAGAYSFRDEYVLSCIHLLEDKEMLRLALLFLVIAIIAAFLGFGLVAGVAYGAAKILFFIFIVLAVLAFLGGALRSPPV